MGAHFRITSNGLLPPFFPQPHELQFDIKLWFVAQATSLVERIDIRYTKRVRPLPWGLIVLTYVNMPKLSQVPPLILFISASASLIFFTRDSLSLQNKGNIYQLNCPFPRETPKTSRLPKTTHFKTKTLLQDQNLLPHSHPATQPFVDGSFGVFDSLQLSHGRPLSSYQKISIPQLMPRESLISRKLILKTGTQPCINYIRARATRNNAPTKVQKLYHSRILLLVGARCGRSFRIRRWVLRWNSWRHWDTCCN